MCLYRKLMLNPRYLPNNKNGGNVPVLIDDRVKYVPIKCGVCEECRRGLAREWVIRMNEEIKHDNRGVFVTLTFNEEKLKIYEDIAAEAAEGEVLDYSNIVATKAVRHFLERWRKKFGRSVKHWLITELGHNGTERIHLHGIIWCDNRFDIEERWQNGWVFLGDYVNEKTINYIVKYVTKVDVDHPDFFGKILCSKGIGRGYIDSFNSNINVFKDVDTREEYISSQFYKMKMPEYYRNHLYNDDEKEKLWLNKLDKQVMFVDKIKVDISNQEGIDKYHSLVKWARKNSKKNGYGRPGIHNDKIYRNRLREINNNAKHIKVKDIKNKKY